MTLLAHPGLPHVFGVHTSSKPYLLVTQFHGVLKGGQQVPYTLKDCLQIEWSNQSMVVTTMATILYQVADALEYIHRRTILHNDIKANNVVLYGAIVTEWKPVLIDFGKACPTDQGRTLHLDKQAIRLLSATPAPSPGAY